MDINSLHREYSSLLSLIARSVDICAIIVSAYLCYILPDWPTPLDSQIYVTAVMIGVLLSLIIFPIFRTYGSWRGKAWQVQIRTIAMAWVTVFAVLIVLAFITKTSTMFSRQWIITWAVLGFILIVVFRSVLGFSLKLVRLKGWNHKRVIVLGAGNLGNSVAKRLTKATATGLKVYALLDDNEKLHGKTIEGINIEGNLDEAAKLVDKYEIDEIWIALPLRAEARIKDVLHELRNSTVDIRFVPDIFNLTLLNHSITEIAGLPVLNLSESPMHGINWFAKNLEDKLLSLFILILVSPVMILLALGVKLSSPGPIFYRQERVSWNGKPFMMLKFRSMPVEVEDNSGPVWAKAGERRATRFGAFLRKTSLDELPQFLNVLKGDMSIVGPRPERPVFVSEFKEKIPAYMKKHLVKAGITGWAQINGWRGDTDLNSRIEYDLHYIENWSVWFDLKIIFLTLIKGFVHKHAY